MEASIKFSAEIIRINTMADGAIRVSLDLPEDKIPQMAMLAECKRQGIYLHFEAREYDPLQETV